jgi:hypothetical protein
MRWNFVKSPLSAAWTRPGSLACEGASFARIPQALGSAFPGGEISAAEEVAESGAGFRQVLDRDRLSAQQDVGGNCVARCARRHGSFCLAIMGLNC